MAPRHPAFSEKTLEDRIVEQRIGRHALDARSEDVDDRWLRLFDDRREGINQFAAARRNDPIRAGRGKALDAASGSGDIRLGRLRRYFGASDNAGRREGEGQRRSSHVTREDVHEAVPS